MTLWTVTVAHNATLVSAAHETRLDINADLINFDTDDDGTLRIYADRDNTDHQIGIIRPGWTHAYATDCPADPQPQPTPASEDAAPEPELMPDDWADPVVPDLDDLEDATLDLQGAAVTDESLPDWAGALVLKVGCFDGPLIRTQHGHYAYIPSRGMPARADDYGYSVNELAGLIYDENTTVEVLHP